MNFSPSKDLNLLVESHKEATRLRALGKPIWSGTLKIKEFINSDVNDKGDLSKVASAISARCKMAFKKDLDLENDPDNFDFDLDGAMSILDDMAAGNFVENQSLDDAKSEFNYALQEIYDHCDKKRIWVA